MQTPSEPWDDRADRYRLQSLLDEIDALAALPGSQRNRNRGEELCEQVEALIGARLRDREARARSAR